MRFRFSIASMMAAILIFALSFASLRINRVFCGGIIPFTTLALLCQVRSMLRWRMIAASIISCNRQDHQPHRDTSRHCGGTCLCLVAGMRRQHSHPDGADPRPDTQGASVRRRIPSAPGDYTASDDRGGRLRGRPGVGSPLGRKPFGPVHHPCFGSHGGRGRFAAPFCPTPPTSVTSKTHCEVSETVTPRLYSIRCALLAAWWTTVRLPRSRLHGQKGH
jgi:hypothetical protein